jgi:hypothetical protein
MESERSAIDGIFIPDILTPGQYYDCLRGDNAPARPIKRLMLAVLVDAIRCYQTYVNSHSRAQRRMFVEAEAWLMDSKADGPFAFETVCATLDIDPSCLRQGLRRWRLQELDGTNTCRLSRRAPVTGARRIGAPTKRRPRKLPKELDGYDPNPVADGGVVVEVDGDGNGETMYQEGVIAPDGLGYRQPGEMENIDGADDIDDADVNVPSWIPVPEVAPVASL